MLFKMEHGMVLSFESVNETLKSDFSIEVTEQEPLVVVFISNVVQGRSNIGVERRNIYVKA